MKAIMTGVALAAVIAAAPALAGERWQVAQAESGTEQIQPDVQSTPCPEGETQAADGSCAPDAAGTGAAEEPAVTEEPEAAQTEEPAAEEPATETAQEPAVEEEPEAEAAETEEPAGEETEMVAESGEKFIGEQGDNSILASELVGLTVYNTADEALGDINDIAWAEDGGIEAVVIGVGGFLGIGEKQVAVAFDAFNMSTDENGDRRIVLDATSDELAAAPDFVTAAEKLALLRAEQEQSLPPAEGMPAPAPAQ
jgi:hypothetical protein